MGLDLTCFPGQTPLEPEETEGLRIPAIATRGELDEFEQHNIEQAMLWTLKRRFKPEQIFTEAFVKEVHKRMYGEVWAWAGQFRKTEKNIGVDKWKIGLELRQLLEDTIWWTANKIYSPDEIAIRFKHRLVSTHCFPNGNGRHSRLMADIVADQVFNRPVFSWGAIGLTAEGQARAHYLAALKTADAGRVEALLAFARS